MLFVGDRLDIDIIGALKANMLTAIKKAYTNTRKEIPPGVIRIDRLSELPDLIAGINRQFAGQCSGV